MDDTDDYPAFLPAPASYHWTPKLQRDFLESLATNGSVKISATKVGMSPSAIYQLKHRAAGAAFKLGCAAAVLIARGRLVDELLDRAIWGYDETAELQREEGRSFARRRRIDSRLGLAMLARLDKMVEAPAEAGEDRLAQLIASDWPGFLALFDAAAAAQDAAAPHDAGSAGDQPGPLAAALAVWLAGRAADANPLAALWQDSAIANEVAQISVGFGADGESEETPEQAAAAMTVWYDDHADDWRTDFPPPVDFWGHEEGQFGDPAYARALDDDELAVYENLRAAAVTPLLIAGEAARRAFFARLDPANDAAAAAGGPAVAGVAGVRMWQG